MSSERDVILRSNNLPLRLLFSSNVTRTGCVCVCEEQLVRRGRLYSLSVEEAAI